MNGQPLPLQQDIRALMELNPAGMVLIGQDGHVEMINQAFGRLCDMASERLLGLSEADFNALLRQCPMAVKRCETEQFGLRAIYYFSPFSPALERHQEMRHTAELLRESLASIQGFAELLLMQDFDEVTRKDLTATLLGQVEEMVNLINARLDLD
jgi:signal transduction histidine kinase